MTKHDYSDPRDKFDDTAPWYTPLLYFASMALMAYALLWLATIASRQDVDCWWVEMSAGCLVVWEGER